MFARLHDLQISAEPLSTLWADVLAERIDPEVAQWRAYEARLGYDADEAPEDLIGAIDQLLTSAGKSAAEEILPVLRPHERETIKRLMELSDAPGVLATFSSLPREPNIANGLPPWEAGREIAHWLRGKIDHGSGPISDTELSDLLGVQTDALRTYEEGVDRVGLGVRTSSGAETILHFRKRNPPGRRFEAARFLAEHLTSPTEDRWLPLVDRGSARQKLQRAFAAELLAPIKDLQDFIGPSGTSERMEEAGEVYGVSPLAIRSQLANHGLLAPDDVMT